MYKVFNSHRNISTQIQVFERLKTWGEYCIKKIHMWLTKIKYSGNLETEDIVKRARQASAGKSANRLRLHT